MVKTGWNTEDVALALYDYMDRKIEFDDYATTLFNDECRDILKQIDEKLVKVMEYADVEEIETLMFEFGELRGKQYFVKGYQTGISVQNSFKNN